MSEQETASGAVYVEPVSLSGKQPHPDYGGWSGFLATCELRDEVDGVRFYGKNNCNYIVFPDGTLVQNYGYHGNVLMSRICEEGGLSVLTQIQHDYAEIACLIARWHDEDSIQQRTHHP